MCHPSPENSQVKVGGERGIRTLGRVSPTHAFQACSLNHSDISPNEWKQQLTHVLAQVHDVFFVFVAHRLEHVAVRQQVFGHRV